MVDARHERTTSPWAVPGLAARALVAGLVDELHLFLVPVTVGRGKRAAPDDVPLDLDLRVKRRFVSGVVDVRCGIRATTLVRPSA